jgi:hypothetical protein
MLSLSAGMLRTVRARRWPLLLCASVFSLLCYLLATPVLSAGLRLFHMNPFLYERRVETYDFRPTPAEEACLRGEGADAALAVAPIPKVVHFIWGLKEGRGPHARFGFMEYLSIRSALVALRPDEVVVHHASLDQSGEWFRKVRANLTLVHHDPATDEALRTAHGWQAAHQADVLRLAILHRAGGIYLDLDVIALRPFDALLRGRADVVMGHEGGNRAGMANAAVVARPGAAFLERWMASYASFSRSEWNYHSVTLPKEMALRHPAEVCALPPTAFFWPTWTFHHVEHMHRPLSRAEARAVERDLRDHAGALFDGQLAYHAWSQMAWAPYLRHLTPEAVRTQDTRFNIMVRRFLE